MQLFVFFIFLHIVLFQELLKFITLFSLCPLESSISWCIVFIHFWNFNSISHSVPPFFANNFIKTPQNKPNLAIDFHRYIKWQERDPSLSWAG